jgi:hypothetical protein
MKKILSTLILSAILTPLFSQESTPAQDLSKPVRNTFGTGVLIENQTVATPYKGGIELNIQHRFSRITNYHDLFGIYGSANTRIGLNYGITDRIMVGIGTTKDYKLQDIQWKYLILQQTMDDKMPVSLSYYGNLVIDARSEDAFGPTSQYKFIHRLSYMTQLIVARKFGERISVQVAPSMAYFNSAPKYLAEGDTVYHNYKNLNFGVSAGLRAALFGAHSLILEYDQLLTKQSLGTGDPQPKPNLSLGWEIGTGTHTFQVFVTNYNQIINQRNLVFNTNDFTKGDYMVGFNILVRF